MAKTVKDLEKALAVKDARIAELEAEIKKLTEAKKAVRVARVESMEALGSRLLKENASKEDIEKAFLEAYARKGNTNVDFIVKKRIPIYMNIAMKRVPKKTPQAVVEEAK